MRDMGSSDDPRVQAQLDRLSGLSIQRDTLGLDAIETLLSRLGDPHKHLPPVFHVAGTNGKGSTCAFLRAMLEAQGYRVHVTTSPHLVRYNERFRVAGKLIEDARLAKLLEDVFDAAEGLGCSFFEITIAAAFMEFARVPADVCVVEVGLGGRLDATNVMQSDVLAACGIAALGIDHEKFLLAPEEGVPKDPMARIAFEKAGIAKGGVPLVAMMPDYCPEAVHAIRQIALDRAVPLVELTIQQLIEFPPENCSLSGKHQSANAALAAAMVRSQTKVSVSEASIAAGIGSAQWPARMQRLCNGPLTGKRQVLLDGGHNRSAGDAVAGELDGTPVHLIIGMLDNKDPGSLVEPLSDIIKSITAVPVPGHDAHPASAFGAGAKSAADLSEAMAMLPDDNILVLIAGSLYLAGQALKLNDEIPD
ncbi:bifunctional folylpolyglutamate synthase/dihydrofolate synthase [Erythrobacter insulae]|uniref:Bifunctional folylpolyglutamate synthase/dihydrofolate synthase n=1 Tax=Erythrobacter insulae TaxID=2584124 RepID=A0A547PE27_9SPHN|nr:bifunctional folylpolyglutamate synthase/dihydrofolate synthase [Erythrobacter insulae]TRD12393.1 bifunctional folylpolyglutamate synthase/dihydrofolate synthase [Erythrobacter insulae]